MKTKEMSEDVREMIDELYNDEVPLNQIIKRVHESFSVQITKSNIYQVLKDRYKLVEGDK